MRKTLGPVTVYDTNPARLQRPGLNDHPVGRAGLVPSNKAPYQRWDGNQATYLFFPAFAAFLLVLLSSLGQPIIPGIYIVSVRMAEGTLTFGTWHWCTSNVEGFDDVCLGDPGTAGNKISQLGALVGLNTMTATVPHSYLVAAAVMHVFANVLTWMTVVWTLAATGAWRNKEKHAWSWTRWAFRLTLASAVSILIAWSIDLGMFGKVSDIVSPDGSQPKIVPGPSVWMLMTALILEVSCFVAEVGWLRNKPRPLWTTKAGDGDFHDPMPAPLSAALPPSEELPPTWESLAINTPTVSNEKQPLPDVPEETPSIEERGFAV